MRTKPRKPTKLRLLEGGRRGALPRNEPMPPASIPKPPSHLHRYAIERWRALAPALCAIGLLTELDRDVFGAFCQCYARWRIAEERIAALAATDSGSEGLLARMPSGAIVQSPLIGIANTAMKSMLRYAAELGLSPSARASIERNNPDDGDQIAAKYGLL